MRLFFYLFDELFDELILVLDFPTVLNWAIVIINISFWFDATPVDTFILLKQLPQRWVAYLLEVVLVILFLHIVFPGFNNAIFMSLGNCLVVQEEFSHKSMDQFGDVLEVRIVGLYIFVEVLDD